MASRQSNGEVWWRTGTWSGLVLLAVLDGSLLMLPATTGHHDRPDAPATRRATAQPSREPATRTARQDGVQPISDLVVPR